jgi:hypothetical protein
MLCKPEVIGWIVALQGLDMAEFVHEGQSSGPLLYDCFAFSSHTGNFSGGHYTAFARNPPSSWRPDTVAADGEEGSSAVSMHNHPWFLFNDACVTHVADSNIDTCSAYLLFYRRRAEADQDPPDLVAQCLCDTCGITATSPSLFLFSCSHVISQQVSYEST